MIAAHAGTVVALRPPKIINAAMSYASANPGCTHADMVRLFVLWWEHTPGASEVLRGPEFSVYRRQADESCFEDASDISDVAELAVRRNSPVNAGLVVVSAADLLLRIGRVDGYRELVLAALNA